MLKSFIFIAFTIAFVSSCTPYQGNMNYGSTGTDLSIDLPKINAIQTITIDKGSSVPVTGEIPDDDPGRIITFTEIGEEVEILTGETVNIIYDGIEPEETYIHYTSTYDGYIIKLASKNDPLQLIFDKMCQKYIVASPTLVSLVIPNELRYEQVVWTPRSDGYWEVRIGTTQRGCKSEDLNNLMDIRAKDKNYNKNLPR
jgi:hypothetical protein